MSETEVKWFLAMTEVPDIVFRGMPCWVTRATKKLPDWLFKILKSCQKLSKSAKLYLFL